MLLRQNYCVCEFPLSLTIFNRNVSGVLCHVCVRSCKSYSQWKRTFLVFVLRQRGSLTVCVHSETFCLLASNQRHAFYDESVEYSALILSRRRNIWRKEVPEGPKGSGLASWLSFEKMFNLIVSHDFKSVQRCRFRLHGFGVPDSLSSDPSLSEVLLLS